MIYAPQGKRYKTGLEQNLVQDSTVRAAVSRPERASLPIGLKRLRFIIQYSLDVK
jgi:hypothetical protein